MPEHNDSLIHQVRNEQRDRTARRVQAMKGGPARTALVPLDDLLAVLELASLAAADNLATPEQVDSVEVCKKRAHIYSQVHR